MQHAQVAGVVPYRDQQGTAPGTPVFPLYWAAQSAVRHRCAPAAGTPGGEAREMMTAMPAPHHGERDDPPAAGHSTLPATPPGTEPSSDPALNEPLTLTVHHPRPGICVLTVEGELDMLTTPRLHACAQGQLATVPAHLILDLQSVRFMGSHGLHCLLQIRDLVSQTSTLLHLAGLITRTVARPLEVTELITYFNTYPTLTDTLATLSR
jgi:anti-sigma B factor antagonist